jgi:putative acetyltransferase
MMRIIPGDLDDPRVASLLRTHLESARAQTAPGSAHALDLGGLRSPEISLWAIWEEDALLGVGALKRLTPDHGEVKSMHTALAARRRGAGGAMLRHIIASAREGGISRLSLETGSWEYFRPARALYSSHGFVECAPFADYVPDPNSVFMTLDLAGSRVPEGRPPRGGGLV